jgi:hypothetical protein
MGLGSGNNAVLVSNCNSLQNLTVDLWVTEDLITAGNNGFSLQLNCYPQTNPQSTHEGTPLNWAQYVIAVENNSVQWGDPVLVPAKGFRLQPQSELRLIRLCLIESNSRRLGDEDCAPH